jgi:hypothetical protein
MWSKTMLNESTLLVGAMARTLERSSQTACFKPNSANVKEFNPLDIAVICLII